MTTRHSFDARGWTWITGALALGSAVLGTSCLQVNTGHCMLTGGDVACGEAELCVGAVGGRSDAIESADAQGCIATLPAEGPSWVHVEYGLPTAALMQNANGRDAETATVEGIVTRVLEERGFTFDPSNAGCRERLEGIGNLSGIRERILGEDGKRSRVRKITFNTPEVERVTSLNAAISAALLEFEAECVLDPVLTDTSTGPNVTTTSEETSNTTEAMPCEGHDECTDPDAPFCGTSGECVGTCDETDDPDVACAGQDPTRPVCDRGVCVQCTPTKHAACTDTTPICDDATNTCVACTAHEQCGEAACNLFDGDCLPAGQVVHVGPGQMYTTLGEAVGSFTGEEPKGTIIVHPGPPNYDESVLVGGGRVLAFLAADLGPRVEPPRWVRTSGNEPQLTVGPGTTVLMDGLQLVGNLSSSVPALRVNGRAWLDRSRVVQNAGGGIGAESSATLVLRNCFVGGSVTGVAALAIDGGIGTLQHTTVIGGFGALAAALSCTTDSMVSVMDSIVLLQSDNDPVTCEPAVFERSASEVDLSGSNNENVGNFDDTSTWFANVGTGDFHLTPSGATTFDDIALWALGDPSTDIDGDPRPSTNDTPDFAGADVP